MKKKLLTLLIAFAMAVTALCGVTSVSADEAATPSKPEIDMRENAFYVVDQVNMTDAYENVETGLTDYGGGNSETRFGRKNGEDSYIVWKILLPEDTTILKISSCFNTVALSVSTDGESYSKKWSVDQDLQIADTSNLLEGVQHTGTVYIKVTGSADNKSFKLRDYVNFAHNGTILTAGETFPSYYTTDTVGFSVDSENSNFDSEFFVSNMSVGGQLESGVRYADGGFPIDASRSGKVHGGVLTYKFDGVNTLDMENGFAGAKLKLVFACDAAVAIYTGEGTPDPFGVENWQFVLCPFTAAVTEYTIDVTDYLNENGGLYVRFSDATGVSGGGAQVIGMSLTGYYEEEDPTITAVSLSADNTTVTVGTAVTVTAAHTPATTTPATVVWYVNDTVVEDYTALTYTLGTDTAAGTYKIKVVIDGVASEELTITVEEETPAPGPDDSSSGNSGDNTGDTGSDNTGSGTEPSGNEEDGGCGSSIMSVNVMAALMVLGFSATLLRKKSR